MPRYARRQSRSGFYHIMLRGNERKSMFNDDEDRFRFIDTLSKMKGNENFNIYAYCLMSNHVHLLLREGKDSIQRSIKRIGISYVYYFNNKYQRVGHLFQDRFRSEAVEEESYILAASRYIHKNPVKAGIVEKAEDFRWSSYKEYISKPSGKQGLVEREFLLSFFSREEEQAIKLFKEYTNESVEDDFIDDFTSTNRTKIIDPHITNLRGGISKILGNSGYNLENLKDLSDNKLRNELLREIKRVTGASVRELSSQVGISKDIISRA